MIEYDLMRSIGELDEKLLRRYDAETARAVRRAARRRRLILDLILLLLLAGAVLWLILGRSAAAQGVETQITEAAAAPEPLPFSFPEQLRQLPEGWYEWYANCTIVEFNWKEKNWTEEEWQSFWTDIQDATVEEARKVQAEKDARFPYYGTLPAPDPASSCSLIPEGDGWKLEGAFYRAMPEPEYDCGWRVDLAAFQPLGQSPEGAAVYGCPAGSRQPVLLLLESGDAEAPSRRWLYCPSLLNPDPTALALSDFQLTQDPALTETLWTLHTDAVQAGEAILDELPSILSLDQQSVCLVLKELPCLSYWISYVRVLGERQAFVRNRPQQRDLFWSDPTAIWRSEAPIDMNESLCRKLDGSAFTFLPQSREDRFADPALQARFAEAAAGLDLSLEADALRFFESLCQYLKDETRYFYHRELRLEAITLYQDGVISAVYRGQRASGMVRNFCEVFVSQADGHLICLLDEKGLIDPTDLDRSWVSGAYLELDPGQSALLHTRRDAERVYYDCMLCIRNPGSEALRVRLYGSYRGRDGASPPRMAAYALSEAGTPQGAGGLFLLPPGETLLRVCFVDPTRSSGTLRHSTLPQLLYLVTDPPPGLYSYGPEPFLEPCDNSAVTPICSQDNNLH